VPPTLVAQVDLESPRIIQYLLEKLGKVTRQAWAVADDRNLGITRGRYSAAVVKLHSNAHTASSALSSTEAVHVQDRCMDTAGDEDLNRAPLTT
jgi:hypothetical protein